MSNGYGRMAIEIVATALGDLRGQIMFLGGATVGLLVTNPLAPLARLTDDVDFVVDVAGYAEYVQLITRLREIGFVEDAAGRPTCRWLLGEIKVDVMTTGAAPGPTNRWYAEAMANAQPFALTSEVSVLVITPPYFIADKLDTLGDGRRGDYVSSHDLEDVITVIDGRDAIESDIRSAPPSVRKFLAQRFAKLLADPSFVDAIPGHLPGDTASQARLPVVIARMRAIAGAH